MADFNVWYSYAQKWEGFYSNSPNDTGGETYKGIARNHNPDWAGWAVVDAEKARFGGKLKHNHKINSPALDNLVSQLAKKNYWNPVQGDLIKNQSIASLLADARWGGDAGKYTVRNFQKYLGILPDGKIGNGTIGAINSANSKNAFAELKKIRANYFKRAGTVAKNSGWVNGWLNRLRDLDFIPDTIKNPGNIVIIAGLVCAAFLILNRK